MPVTAEMVTLGAYVTSIVGRKGDFNRIAGPGAGEHVDILTAADTPEPGLITQVSLGVSERSLELSTEHKPLRVEMILTTRGDEKAARDILADCALTVINSGRIQYGAVITDAVTPYLSGSPMAHVMMGEKPAIGLYRYDFEDRIVTWLNLIPISSAERDFIRDKGPQAFEALLAGSGADIFDLDRKSIL